MILTCQHCSREFESKTWNRKYCSQDCRTDGRKQTKQARSSVEDTLPKGLVRQGLEQAVTEATHLTKVDDATLAAARALADKIDQWDVIVQWAKLDAEHTGSRPMVPSNDGNSLAVYLKYCESLGLSPTSRKSLDLKQEEVKGGKLAALRAIQSA